MKYRIEVLYINVRYRVLHTENESYVLDMGGSSLWKLLFPFLYWILPLTVYKTNDHQAIDAIVFPDTAPKGLFTPAFIATPISLMLGNMIYPLIDHLDIEVTETISVIIISFILLFVLLFFIFSNRLLGKKIAQHIKLEKLPREKVCVHPKSKGHLVENLVLYLAFLALSVGATATAIQYPNAFIYFAATIIYSLTLGIGFTTIRPGETKVVFKPGKEQSRLEMHLYDLKINE